MMTDRDLPNRHPSSLTRLIKSIISILTYSVWSVGRFRVLSPGGGVAGIFGSLYIATQILSQPHIAQSK